MGSKTCSGTDPDEDGVSGAVVPHELAWLNAYNERCREVLLPQLEDEPDTAAW